MKKYVVVCLAIVVIVGAMGDFVKTQFFPIYAASSIAEIGIFRRLDSIYLSIFTMGIFVKISLLILLFGLAFKSIFPKQSKNKTAILGGLVLFFSNIAISNFELKFIYDLNVFFVITIVAVVVIPGFLFLYNKKKGL